MIRTERTSRPVRAAAAAAAAAALLAALAGCSSSGSGSGSGSAGAGGFPSSSAQVSSAPGRLTVVAPQVHLVVSDAKVQAAPGGGSTLSMTLRNTGTAPEHLASVHGPKGWATLSGPQVTTAGITLPIGTDVAVGGSNQPKIALSSAPSPAADGTEQLTLIFALAGEVKLKAVVAR